MDLAGVLPYEEGQIYDVKFSRDGSIVLAAGGINGKTGNVVLWNVKSGKRLTELSPDFDTTLTADMSSDRKYLATGSSDKLAKIFSSNGDLIHSIKQHSEWVTNVSISPDGVLVASGDTAISMSGKLKAAKTIYDDAPQERHYFSLVAGRFQSIGSLF